MAKRNKNIIIYLLFVLLFFCGILYLAFYRKKTEEAMVNFNSEELKEFSYGNDKTSHIPKIIWTFWSDSTTNFEGQRPEKFGEGVDNVVVNMCIDSWKHYNPDYDIRILNKSNYSEYVDIDVSKIQHSNDFIARFADYVRCLVLSKYGGFWIDASIICHHPFSWVHAIQNKTKVEFVGYYIGDVLDNKYPVIENWFFACIPNSQFMNDWSDEFLSTGNHKTIEDYLKDVGSQGIDTSKVQIPDYLTMHVSAQKVIQKNPKKYDILVFAACSGPLKYLCDANFHDETAVKNLLDPEKHSTYHKYTFVKICGGQRKILETYNKTTLLPAFSNV